MAEAEQEHRVALERQGQSAAIAESKRGQWLGTIISLAAIAAAAFGIWVGAHWGAIAALVGVPILGIVKAIVDSRSHPDR